MIDYTWRGVPEHRNSYSDYRLVRERVCALRGRRVARPAAGAAKTAYAFSPPFPCLTVVGRERGAGTSSTQIVVRARE